MDALKTSGEILDVLTDDDGGMKIAITGHAGYFTVLDRDMDRVGAIIDGDGLISFSYDRHLNIVSVHE